MTLLVLVSLSLMFGVIVVSAWEASNPESVKDYIHYVASKEKVNIQTVLSIAKCESGFNKNALNHTLREYSVGIFQINLKAHPHITKEQALNPFWNINWAIDRMSEGKWSWWTCWKPQLRTNF